MTLQLLLALVVLACGLSVVAIGVRGRSRAVGIDALLADDEPFGACDVDTWRVELEAPATSRLLRPLVDRATGAVHRLLPRARLAAVRTSLVQAGLSGRLTAEEYVALQVLSGIVGGLLAVLAWDGTLRSMATSLLIVFVGLIAPKAMLDNRRTTRVEQVQRELPDVLDLLAICVEAGQGLEGAMRTVAQREDGVLCGELRHSLREMELGVGRRGALEHLRDRVGVPDVAGLVAALIQADVLGTPVGDVLHAQAVEQRRRRRAQVREQAAKLPVKMLVPLTVFILPALFVVILGPAALSIREVLG